MTDTETAEYLRMQLAVIAADEMHGEMEAKLREWPKLANAAVEAYKAKCLELESELRAVTDTLDTCRRERGEALDKLKAAFDLLIEAADGHAENPQWVSAFEALVANQPD